MRNTDQVHGLLSVSPQCKDPVVDQVIRQHEFCGIYSMGGKPRTSSDPPDYSRTVRHLDRIPKPDHENIKKRDYLSCERSFHDA